MQMEFVANGVCGKWSLWQMEFVANGVCGKWSLWQMEFVANVNLRAIKLQNIRRNNSPLIIILDNS
jgi:hypothetical protein